MFHGQEKTISPLRQETGLKEGSMEELQEKQSVSAVKEVSSRSLLSLSERLQENSRKEQQLIEETIREGLQQQRRDLTDLIRHEQKAIESAITEQRKFLQRVWKREWIIQVILGAGLALGVIVGSWGWTEYQISRLREAQIELAQVRNVLEKEKLLLSGLELYPAPNGGVWVRVKSREDWIEAVELNGLPGTYVEALVKKGD